MKLKIKPSEKIHRRYLLISGAEKEDVERAILDYIGILGWARAAPVFVKRDVLAVERKELENVRAALELSEKKIIIKRVSGTIKGLEK